MEGREEEHWVPTDSGRKKGKKRSKKFAATRLLSIALSAFIRCVLEEGRKRRHGLEAETSAHAWDGKEKRKKGEESETTNPSRGRDIRALLVAPSATQGRGNASQRQKKKGGEKSRLVKRAWRSLRGKKKTRRKETKRKKVKTQDRENTNLRKSTNSSAAAGRDLLL